MAYFFRYITNNFNYSLNDNFVQITGYFYLYTNIFFEITYLGLLFIFCEFIFATLDFWRTLTFILLLFDLFQESFYFNKLSDGIPFLQRNFFVFRCLFLQLSVWHPGYCYLCSWAINPKKGPHTYLLKSPKWFSIFRNYIKILISRLSYVSSQDRLH